MLYALGLLLLYCRWSPTVYFINNEVDLAMNEIMYQLQYQYQAAIAQQEHMSRSTHVLLVTITIK